MTGAAERILTETDTAWVNIHDDNVHPQNTQAFADALIQSGKLFEQMIYPMRKHGISDRAATLHLQRTMLDFWKRNL